MSLGARLSKNLLDLNARAGYSLIDSNPMTPAAQTSEYYLFDWEYAQTPEESSWIASSWVSYGGSIFILSHFY